MFIRLTLALLALPLMPALAQSRPGADRAAIQREVDSRTQSMTRAFEQNDLRTVARFYADDARIYASGMRAEGRSAIDRFWLKIGQPRSWKMETIDVGGSRDEPYQLVRSTLVTGAGRHSHTSHAMCLLVWRRDPDGQLRIRLDVFASYADGQLDLSQVRGQ